MAIRVLSVTARLLGLTFLRMGHTMKHDRDPVGASRVSRTLFFDLHLILVKPRVVRSCVVYVRKTSHFGPCIRNLTGQSIRRVSSKKMAYETCSSQNVQAHPEV